MAIAIDASSPVRWTGTPADNVAITSASFTAPANAVLVVCVNADQDPASSALGLNVSDSGGLVWTERVHRDDADTGAAEGCASIWTAACTTSASRTVSVLRNTTNGGTDRISAKCYVVTGADKYGASVGQTGEDSSGTNNITPTLYTSSVDNSRGFFCATDWNQRGTPTSTDEEDGADYAGAISVLSAYKAADTTPASTAVTGNMDGGGSAATQWNWVALEVKPVQNRTDEFTRANNASSIGTPTDSGSAWVVGTGTWGITSNTGYCSAAPAADGYVYVECSRADVEVSVTLSTIGTGTAAGVCARIASGDMIFWRYDEANTKTELFELSGGGTVYTQLGSSYTATLSSGAVLKLQCDGTTIKGYVDGVERASGTSSQNQTSTLAGLYAYAETVTRFDSFNTTGISAAGGDPIAAGEQKPCQPLGLDFYSLAGGVAGLAV